MKNKKTIVVINKFPKILFMIVRELHEDGVEYILDSSGFSQPVPLLCITNPDELLLNLKLPSEHAVGLMSGQMHLNMEIKRGMITNDPVAYYMSLCSTLHCDYCIDRYLGIELLPGAISRQQLN